MPPPNAITTLDRSPPAAIICSASASTSARRLRGSPPGKNRTSCVRSRMRLVNAAPWSFQTSAVVTTNTLPARGGRNSATRASEPRSTMAS